MENDKSLFMQRFIHIFILSEKKQNLAQNGHIG